MSSKSETTDRKDSALIIVDMLNDFIDGSMACLNAREAVNETVSFIDSRTASSEPEDENEITGMFPILFICDHHPADHCSFRENGGLWPTHCVSGTRGSEIDDSLKSYVSEEFTFYKGCDKNLEQYSGWEGVNTAGQSVAEVLDLLDINDVYVCGIATEYCVKATAEDLHASGKKVTVLKDALAYVDHGGHLKALEELGRKGIAVV